MLTKETVLHATWGLLLLAMGYIFNDTTKHLERVSNDLEDLKIVVASDCVRKADLNRFESKLDHMNDMLFSLVKDGKAR